ncbi:MAG: hypothetical protein RI935_140 [Candidatus Parcubacteria bacterium]|jgi:uncharacterized membrane protein
MTSITFFAIYKQLFTILHVLCVIIGMGAALVTDILFSFFASNKTLSSFEIKIIRLLSKVVTLALVGIVLTGITIFLSDPLRYMASAKFLTKMSIVLILCINGYLLHRFIFSRLSEKDFLIKRKTSSVRKMSFVLGAVSLISWVSAMSLGVLDKINLSYTTAFSLYLVVLVFGAMISQVIAKKLYP